MHLGAVLARFTEAPVVIASVQAPHDRAPQVGDIRLELEPHGIQADCEVLIGTSAATALHEAAEDGGASLLVVGSSRCVARGRVLAGATARLLSGAPCPVAVAPRGWERHELPKRIGVAFRDTADGREALRGALALARHAHARLRIVTVVEEGFRAALGSDARRAGKDVDDVIAGYEMSARRAAEKAALAQLERQPGVEAEIESLVGDPVDVLRRLTEHIDLLVCGSRGYGPLRAVLLGAVSRRIVTDARCPVAVLPHGRGSRLGSRIAEARAAAHA